MSIKYVVHDKEDNVGVAIEDIRKDEEVEGVFLKDNSRAPVIKAINDIPLGHKIALTDLNVGQKIIKYGRPVGLVFKPIRKGEHVHIHNVKSIRWGKFQKKPA